MSEHNSEHNPETPQDSALTQPLSSASTEPVARARLCAVLTEAPPRTTAVMNVARSEWKSATRPDPSR